MDYLESEGVNWREIVTVSEREREGVIVTELVRERGKE